MASRHNAPSKFPLRLMPSMRKGAEQFSAKEGVSLNQFINVAIAEKVAHLEHEEWLQRRKKVTNASITEALQILDRGGNQPPEPGDELPEGYRRVAKAVAQADKRSPHRKNRASR